MTTDGPCKWYYFFVDAGTDTKTIQNMYVANDATNVMSTSGSFDVTAVKVPEKDSWLVICAKPDSGAKAKMSVVKLNGSSLRRNVRQLLQPLLRDRQKHIRSVKVLLLVLMENLSSSQVNSMNSL